MGKLVKAIVTASILCVLTAGGFYFGYPGQEIQISSDHVIYESTDQLIEYSDLIIVGQALQGIEEAEPTFVYHSEGRIMDFYSIFAVKSLKVLKGDVDSKNVSVLHSVALLSSPYKASKDLFIREDVTPMEKGNKYLLFLAKTDIPGVYSIISLNQGKFSIDGLDAKENMAEATDEQFKKLKTDALTKFAAQLGQ